MKTSKKNIARRGRLAAVWLLYYTLWEAVHHVDVLFRAGGGALAVLQHVFPVALVCVAAGLAGSGGPALFFCADCIAESRWLRKPLKIRSI